MKKYKFYNNTAGVVQGVSRSGSNLNVTVSVTSGNLGITNSDVYPITFVAMDDSLYTAFSTSCTYNATTKLYTLTFNGDEIPAAISDKYMFTSAEWELRLTQQELNDLFNEVYMISGSLVQTPTVTGVPNPVRNVNNVYTFSSSSSFTGATIASFIVDIPGVVQTVVTASDNAGSYTLNTSLAAGTELEMYVTAVDSVGYKSSAAYRKLLIVDPYVDKPTVTDPTDNEEVVALSFTIGVSNPVFVGISDTLSKSEFSISDSSGSVVYTKEVTGPDTTATITDANLQRGETYKIKVRQYGTTITTPSLWSDEVTFRTADIYVVAPSITAPVSGNSIYKYNVVISGSAFTVSAGGTDTHSKTQYQILDATDSVIYDSGESNDLTTTTIAELTNAVVGSSYKIRIRYKGATYGWSSWSSFVAVTILSAYVNAPVLTAPTQNAQIKGTTVAFVQQGFTTSGTTDTQSGVQYQLLAADNSVYYDSGELTTDYSAHTATISKPSLEIALRARARNKGANLGWSAWSEYVNITVSPVLHLTFSDDGKLLYVGKPDGTPFDRPDGTFYWLGISTEVERQTPTSQTIASASGFDYEHDGSGVFNYDMVVTNASLQNIKNNPSLIDRTLCTVGSTQDGEYSTLVCAATGIPLSGDALTGNKFLPARTLSRNSTYSKFCHMPSKRELLYLVIQSDAIDTVAGDSFFDTHVAGMNQYNFTSTLYGSGIFNVIVPRENLYCGNAAWNTSLTHTYTTALVTVDCDQYGTILPDKHGMAHPTNAGYHYWGFGANSPLMDYTGRRFWACVSDAKITALFNINRVNKITVSDKTARLNGQLSTITRDEYVYNAYPFQIFGTGARGSQWYVSTMLSQETLNGKSCFVASPYIVLAKATYGTFPDTFGNYSTNFVYYPTSSTIKMTYVNRADDAVPPNKAVVNVALTSTDVMLNCFAAMYEYLPVDTGRKLYRHSSGMGTVMEYTDADSTNKKVLILDASYRSTCKSASTNVCPSTLKQIAPSSTEDTKNAVGNNYVTGFADATRLSMSDSYLNKVWPANKVDSHSSAYNTQQWLELATDPAAAQYASAITVAGTACQVPNLNVALRIFIEANNLDALDPTLSANATKALGDANPNGFFGIDTTTKSLATSSIAWDNPGWLVRVTSSGTVNKVNPTTTLGICPVLELDA